VIELAGCLDELPRIDRRVLILRAAPSRKRPRSRVAVARRLDTRARRVARIEHRAVRRLHRLDRTTDCRQRARPRALEDEPGRALLADFGGASSGTVAAGSGGATTGTDTPEGGVPAGADGSRGSVKGESGQHQGGGTLPGVGIAPSPGSRGWLPSIGIVVGAALVFAAGALYDRRRRRDSTYD
jgi:hypothetical protein